MPEYAVDNVHIAPAAFGKNIPYRGLEWRSTREPAYLIYLFNVSSRTFENVGRINLTIPGVTDADTALPDTPANEKYHYVTSFPQPMLMPKFNDEAGEIGMIEVDARRFVVDLIQPDNLTLSLDAVIKPENSYSINNDYSERGVFFSYSNPPAKEDVAKAVVRMEKYYNRLLGEAATLELTDKAKLSERLAGNPDFAFAANYFGRDVSWNKKQVRPELCPNCGEQKPFGRKFHVNQALGFVCVEPSVEGWKATVAAGVKKYDDVPDEFQWKTVKGKRSLEELAKQIEH